MVIFFVSKTVLGCRIDAVVLLVLEIVPSRHILCRWHGGTGQERMSEIMHENVGLLVITSLSMREGHPQLVVLAHE